MDEIAVQLSGSYGLRSTMMARYPGSNSTIVYRLPAAALYVLLSAATTLVFVADLYTPFGVAVWILYQIPLVLTMLGPRADAPLIVGALITVMVAVTSATDEHTLIPPWVAYLNRACGLVATWAVAWLMRNLLVHRNGLQQEARIREIHTQVLGVVQGEQSTSEIAARTLDVLVRAAGADAGAFYVRTGPDVFRLAGSHGVDMASIPGTFEVGQGMLGQVTTQQALTRFDRVPADSFRVSTAFTTRGPSDLLLMPLVADGATHGLLELALPPTVPAEIVTTLERVGPAVGVALQTAAFRERVSALHVETQRQRDELQTQQEELRVANEELEEQSNALKASQERLHEQQAELEATNAQLEAQTQELETQQQALADAASRAEQASQYKSEFLANMSHELRTPLNSVLILARLLADNRGGGLSDEQVRYANTIHSSGSHLLTLINDILDLARIEAGRVDLSMEDVDLRVFCEGLRETFDPIARDRQLEFAVEVAPTVPAAFTSDSVRLQQILVNLLSNACKFTTEGHVRLRVYRQGERIAFEVEDTGPGIPRDKFDVIFEAFRQADGSTQRRFGGTGLGLSISRQLAHLLGGELLVDSVLGRGSRFTLLVPLLYDANAVPSAGTPGTSLAGRASVAPVPEPRPARVPASAGTAARDDRGSLTRTGRLLLVVEDDQAFAEILCELAHEMEFDCVVASTTDEGMRLAVEMQPTGVLLDVSLPDGSGLALLDRLKRTPVTRHIPVHMMSVDDHTQTALALGAVGYAVKPADRETLVESLRRIEQQTQRDVRRLLIVEDDATLRSSMVELLRLEGVQLHDVGTATEAIEALGSTSYDCVVLDLTLPDASGFDVLDRMSASGEQAFPPVIIYTGQALSSDEEERLRRYSRSVIVKGARSPERLLDEVTLFLHRVEAALPSESQRMLRAARERDELFEGRRILLAEDDVRNIFALSAVLEPRGATMVIARNGREAVDLAATQPPDLVLMDIMMPEMDGLTAIRTLRANPASKNLPIIALTAKARPDDRAQCLAAGASDYMAKPIDIDKLVSLCRVWMAR